MILNRLNERLDNVGVSWLGKECNADFRYESPVTEWGNHHRAAMREVHCLFSLSGILRLRGWTAVTLRWRAAW